MVKVSKQMKKQLRLEKKMDNEHITLHTIGKFYPVHKWNEESKKYDGDVQKHKYTVCLFDNKRTQTYHKLFENIFDKNPIYENDKGYKSMKVTCFADMEAYLDAYDNRIHLHKKSYENHTWWLVFDRDGKFDQMKQFDFTDDEDSD